MNQRAFRIATALSAALWLGACGAVQTGGGVATTDIEGARASASAFDSLLNRQRGSNGLPPLSENARLAAAAQSHADDMVRQAYFSHTGADGSSVGQRVDARGYSWCWVGENIAAGDRTDAAVFGSWMNSPGHRRNMLDRQAVEYGLGRSGNTWVLVLAQPC